MAGLVFSGVERPHGFSSSLDSLWSRAIVELPKAHLHLHFEAGVSPAWAARHAPDVSVGSLWSFDEFIAGFRELTACIGLSRSLIVEAMVDVLVFERSLGCWWVELTVDPFLYPALGSPEHVMGIFGDAAKEASEVSGVGCGLVLAVDRTRDLDSARESVFLSNHPAVVAVGVANDERARPLRYFGDVLAGSKKPLVPHAGELRDHREVEFAARVLGAWRIGHAATASSRFSFLSQVGVEACLTSNHLLGVVDVANHPLPFWLQQGVPVSLHADDPVLMGTDIVGEFLLAQHTFGFSPHDIAQLARNSWEFALCPSGLRVEALVRVNIWEDFWGPRLLSI